MKANSRLKVVSSMSHIFISYSHTDDGYAKQLAAKLEEYGFAVWIDSRIDYGTRWPTEIEVNLNSCAAFIVVMTQKAFESDWVQNELSRAKRLKKPIYPLLLEGNGPWLTVEATQYLDVTNRELPNETFFK